MELSVLSEWYLYVRILEDCEVTNGKFDGFPRVWLSSPKRDFNLKLECIFVWKCTLDLSVGAQTLWSCSTHLIYNYWNFQHKILIFSEVMDDFRFVPVDFSWFGCILNSQKLKSSIFGKNSQNFLIDNLHISSLAVSIK